MAVSAPGIMLPSLSNHVSTTLSRAMGPDDVFFTWILVTSVVPSRLVGVRTMSIVASPRTGGVNFFPASTDFIGGGSGGWANVETARKLAPTTVAATTTRARIM